MVAAFVAGVVGIVAVGELYHKYHTVKAALAAVKAEVYKAEEELKAESAAELKALLARLRDVL